jgi:hypothetical protein
MSERGAVLKLWALDSFSWRASVNDEGTIFEVTLAFDQETGECYDQFSYCDCRRRNCEHKLAAIFAVRDKFLGAHAALEPPKVFGAKPNADLEDAACLYKGSARAKAMSLVASALPLKEPLDIALGFSSFIKLAVKLKRTIAVHDINPETGVLALSAMGDEAYEKGELGLASDLHAITLDILDSIESLAWRGKDMAKNAKLEVLERLDAIAELADMETGKRMAVVLVDVIEQAKRQDTILGAAKAAQPLCRQDPECQRKFMDALEGLLIPFESREMKEARLEIASCAGSKARDEFLRRNMKDPYFELRSVDVLASLDKAAEICWNKLRVQNSYEWGCKLCELLERKGDKEGLRKAREEIAFNMSLTDEEYFSNFDKMKELYTPEEWKYIEAGLVWELKGKTSCPRIFNPRYVAYLKRAENMEELFRACALQPELVEDLFEPLSLCYRVELGEIYENYIFELAKRAASYKNDKSVVGALKMYHKFGFDAESVRQRLVEKHKKRRVFARKLEEIEFE